MSWLNVGKSFSATTIAAGDVLLRSDGNDERGANNALKVPVVHGETPAPTVTEIVLRYQDEGKKKKRKKAKDRKEDHSEAKHSRKQNKKQKRDKSLSLIQNNNLSVGNRDQNTYNYFNNAVVVDDVDDGESLSSFEHSSDSDDDIHHSIRSHNVVNLSNVDVVYMPNGQVALLDKDRDVGSTYTWSIDTSMDRDICMFLDIKKPRWSSSRRTIQNPSQHQSKKLANYASSSRFCDDVYDWDYMNTKSNSNKDAKSKKGRYFTKSFFSLFADPQQGRLFYGHGTTPLADASRPFHLSLLPTSSSNESKSLAVSQYGFVAVPPVDTSIACGVVDAGGKAMMTTDSDLAFMRVKAFRQKYSQSELLKGPLEKLLGFLLQQKSLQRWTLLSSNGSEPVSMRYLNSCADWAADKAVTEKMLSLIEETRKLGSESRNHPSVHILYMKLKINLSPGNIVEQLWRDTVLFCPSSFELRLAKWSNLTLSMSTTSVRRAREEHISMMRSIENDMKNAQVARLLTENMWMTGGAAEDLPLRLQEDINAAKIDSTLALLLLERQLGNIERSIAIVQGLLELNLEVIPKLNVSAPKDSRSERAIEALGSFWDSEHPRIGEEFCSPFKEDGMLPYTSGYGNWVDNGKTARERDSMSHLPSDYGPNIQKQFERWHSKAGSGAIRTVLQSLHGTEYTEDTSTGASEAKSSIPVHSSIEMQHSMKDISVPDMPQPQNKHAKPSAAKYMETAVGEMVSEIKEPENFAEDHGMVYSRIHGYRIPIRQEDSLSSYRRVLDKLQSEGFNNGDEEGNGDGGHDQALNGTKTSKRQKNESVINESWMTHQQIAEEDCQVVDSTEVGYSVRWANDCLLSSTQWRPLRAISNSHYHTTGPGSENEEIELDRVIFFEDIRDHMFVLSPGKVDTIARGIDLEDSTQGFSFRLHQRMVIRCMESLGLLLPLASCSHSLQRRHLNSHLQADNVAAQSCPLLDILLDDLHRVEKDGCECLRTSPRQRLLMSQQRICSVNEVLTAKHKLGYSLGFDTELNFTIRLLENILAISATDKKSKLTTLFNLHLRSVLMQLAVDRWEACYERKSMPEGNAFLSTADADSVRSYCRDLVESTVMQESQSSSTQDTRYYSPLGSFVAWAAYIRAERQIHQSSSSKGETECVPAWKIVDKIFKAVGQQQQSGAASSFPSGFMEFNRVSLELAIECLSTRLRSFKNSAGNLKIFQQRQQSCREVAFAAFQMMRCLVCCSAWEGKRETNGPCYTTFFKFIYSGSAKRSKNDSSFAASDITMVVDAFQTKVQSLLNEAKTSLDDARGRRRTEQSIAACRIHMSPCHYIDATPELYEFIHMLSWIQFLAMLFVDVDESTAVMSASRVAAAAHVADSCLLASINLIRELLTVERTEEGEEEIGVAEAEFVGSSVWDSQIEVSLTVLLERLHMSRLQILEVAIEWLPYGIRIDAMSDPDCNHERRRLLQSLQAAAVTGLRDFPLNISLLNCLVTCTSGLSSDTCSLKGCLLTRSYFNSLQNRRLWCGGLMMIEKYFFLYFMIDSANTSARLRSDSCSTRQQSLRDVGGSLGVAITVDEARCADWSDEDCSAIVNALEQCLSATNRDSFFGGDAGLWLLYFNLLSRINTSRKSRSGVSPKIARGLFYRALGASTAGKALWMAAMGPLRGAFAAKELKTIADSMESCGLWLRR